MSFIVGLGGKKGSGKTSLSCYLSAVVNDILYHNSKNIEFLFQYEDIPRKVYVNDNGLNRLYNFNYSLDNNIIKTYSFADALKQFLLESFDVEKNQLYGSDDEKNTKTKYKWDNLPVFIRWINSPGRGFYKLNPYRISCSDVDLIDSVLCEDDFYQVIFDGWLPDKLREGNMTSRELMQIFGTDIGRKMFDSNIWVDATISKIKSDNPMIAVVDDLRFCSEADSILCNDGAIFLLSRNSSSDDIHGSEKDLDKLSIVSDSIMRIDNHDDIGTKNSDFLSLIYDMLKDKLQIRKQDDISQQV